MYPSRIQVGISEVSTLIDVILRLNLNKPCVNDQRDAQF